VASLLDRFRRRSHPGGVVCYLRENGPIAYELSLFGDETRDRVEAMFETGLAWYWSSAPDRAQRSAEWIELTRWSMAAFNGARASAATLAIVGTEPRDSLGDIAADLAAWGRQFATDHPSPLQIVIHRSGDTVEHVFVAQQAPEHIRGLLQAWAIDRARADRRAYARLRDQSLEALVDGWRMTDDR
jgi:hypothetical protein